VPNLACGPRHRPRTLPQSAWARGSCLREHSRGRKRTPLRRSAQSSRVWRPGRAHGDWSEGRILWHRGLSERARVCDRHPDRPRVGPLSRPHAALWNSFRLLAAVVHERSEEEAKLTAATAKASGSLASGFSIVVSRPRNRSDHTGCRKKKDACDTCDFARRVLALYVCLVGFRASVNRGPGPDPSLNRT
jgi:hypothetical protein